MDGLKGVYSIGSYTTIELRRAYETAIKAFKATNIPQVILLNDNHFTTVKGVFTVEGLNRETTSILFAIQKAKEEAIKAKATKLVYLNSNPLYLIDRKGKMCAA